MRLVLERVVAEDRRVSPLQVERERKSTLNASPRSHGRELNAVAENVQAQGWGKVLEYGAVWSIRMWYIFCKSIEVRIWML
jgi:hypothetical protein